MNGSFIDNRTNKLYYCIDCNKLLTDIYAMRCKSCARKGKNHPNFKGGKTKLYFRIRNSLESKIWRNRVFVRDNYICQKCNQVGGRIEAHHIKSFSNILSEFLKEYIQFSPIEHKEILVKLAMKWKPFWEADNGRTLCEKCHKNIKKINRRQNGKLIIGLK